MQVCLFYNILIAMYGSCIGTNVKIKQRNGNWLFRAVSCCVCNTEDSHFEIRLSIVNKVINDWEHYKDIIVDLAMANSAKD